MSAQCPVCPKVDRAGRFYEYMPWTVLLTLGLPARWLEPDVLPGSLMPVFLRALPLKDDAASGLKISTILLQGD
jgi:hypothetical protein